MLRGFVDTIFSPVILFLKSIYSTLVSARLSVPTTSRLDIFDFFPYFSYFGSGWTRFIVTAAFLAFMYLVLYTVINNIGFFNRLKDLLKWW